MSLMQILERQFPHGDHSRGAREFVASYSLVRDRWLCEKHFSFISIWLAGQILSRFPSLAELSLCWQGMLMLFCFYTYINVEANTTYCAEMYPVTGWQAAFRSPLEASPILPFCKLTTMVLSFLFTFRACRNLYSISSLNSIVSILYSLLLCFSSSSRVLILSYCNLLCIW